MKIPPPICQLLSLTTLFLVPHHASAIQNDTESIKSVISHLEKAIEANDLEAGKKHMTQQAIDETCGNAFSFAIQLSLDEFLEDEVRDPLLDLVRTHGLDKVEIPSSFTDMESMEFPSEEEVAEFRKDLLNAIPAEKQIALATEIRELTSELMFGDNLFTGNITEIEIEKNSASVTIEFKFPNDEMGGEDMEEESFPNFLKFKKVDDQWNWDGQDFEKSNAFFDEPMDDSDDRSGATTEDDSKDKKNDKDGLEASDKLPLIDDLKLSGQTASGEMLDIEEFQGKFVVIGFWSTWCDPCVRELPVLVKIHDALHEHGLEIVGVAADSAKSIKKFTDSKVAIPWRNIVDAETSIAEEFGVEAYPTTLIVDPKGEHVESDLFGIGLLDYLIEGMELDASDFDSLRSEIASMGLGKMQDDQEPEEAQDQDAPAKDDEVELGVGFDAADEDANGSVSKNELQEYLAARLNDDQFPHAEVFEEMDQDQDGSVSSEEFSNRHAVIMGVMGPNYFGGPLGPLDPGADYVPFRGLDQFVDDSKTFGAIFHRYSELADDESLSWPKVKIEKVPSSIQRSAPQINLGQPSSVEDLVQPTAIIGGGGGGMNFFTGGAVIISSDGLAVTNFHIAEAFNEKLVAMTPDGQCHRVIEFIAGDFDRDIALVRLEGENFPFVKIAEKTPKMGSDLVMLHHSENRFFTYDRGYVMRYPRAGNTHWMEISANYAPGGSGCGIFNSNHELVGLVSMIQYGDGPSIADGMDFEENKRPVIQEDDFGPREGGLLLVKHAVALHSIRSLWSPENSSKSD